MTYASLLINTCTVRRYTEAAPRDAYGRYTKTWADHLVDEPCRKVWVAATEVKVGAETIIINDRLFVNDIDIAWQDRVVIDGDTYDVVNVTRRQDSITGHHRECDLVRVEESAI